MFSVAPRLVAPTKKTLKEAQRVLRHCSLWTGVRGKCAKNMIIEGLMTLPSWGWIAERLARFVPPRLRQLLQVSDSLALSEGRKNRRQ